MAIPMLGEFALRLAAGLAGMLLLTPWRLVPPAFFRTHCQILLALLVLAALDLARSPSARLGLVAAVVAAVLGYVASIAWGLGLPRLGLPLAAAIAATVAVLLVWTSRGSGITTWALVASGRLASAALLGSTLSAMLLGHHYLTAPAMSIEPLRRSVACMGVSLAARAAPAALGLALWAEGQGPPPGLEAISPLFLTMRWVVGIAGTAVAAYLAWRTVQIRSTQSATGILYIAMTLVLFGELTAMSLSHETGLVF